MLKCFAAESLWLHREFSCRSQDEDLGILYKDNRCDDVFMLVLVLDLIVIQLIIFFFSYTQIPPSLMKIMLLK